MVVSTAISMADLSSCRSFWLLYITCAQHSMTQHGMKKQRNMSAAQYEGA
jgi:hypothetical protein